MSAGDILPFSRPAWQSGHAGKRGLDIAIATLAILCLSPLMLAIALAIRLDSPGLVLFRQQRYGLERRRFRIYKFRTMRHEADTGFRQAVREDCRITRVGRVLRRVNLDELPQLFNILTGDMALVGPRPHPVELDEKFAPLIENYWWRYSVRPGITGWAQVNGFRGETDTLEKMQGRIDRDLAYLEIQSFRLDLKILLKTMLSAKAYRNAF